MFTLSEDYWEVRDTPSKGKGIFAKKDIPGGTVIGDYLGRVARSEDVDEVKEGLYDMVYNYDYDIVGDPAKIGMHTINHSCSANCNTYPIQNHIIYFAVRKIFASEELTVSYGLPPPEDETYPCPHTCHCGSIICHGTFHVSEESAEEFCAYLEKVVGPSFHNPPPVAPGEQLPPLPSYPSNIEDDRIFEIFGSLEQEPLLCEDNTLPPTDRLRQLIRETGLRLNFHKLGVKVFAVTRKITLLHNN